MARSFEILSKYGAQGDWARNQMAAFMGAPQMTSTATRGNAAGPATPDWQRYYDEQLSNPNLGQASNWEKNAKLRALYNNDKLAFAEDHYRKNGNGAPLPMTGGPAAGGDGERVGEAVRRGGRSTGHQLGRHRHPPRRARGQRARAAHPMPPNSPHPT